MNVPKVRGINRLEVWLSDSAKIGIKQYCQDNGIAMKDLIDHLIREHLKENAPHLLEMETQ